MSDEEEVEEVDEDVAEPAAATLTMRKHAATGPADVVEEEAELSAKLSGALSIGEGEVEEAGAYDEDFEPGSPEKSPGRGGRRAVAYWATLAEGVPPGPSGAATAARRSLFARLDVDADGFVTLSELERELPGALGAAAPSTKLPPTVPPLVSNAFAVAKGMADGHHLVELSDSGCTISEFDALCAYLHAAFTVLSCLEVAPDTASLPNLDPKRCDALIAKLPAAFGLETSQAREGLQGLDGWGAAGVRGEAVTRWVAQAALRTLCPTQRSSGGPAGAGGAGRHPAPSRPPVPSADEDDEDEDEDAIEDVDEDEDDAPPPMGGGRLEPVSTETPLSASECV